MNILYAVLKNYGFDESVEIKPIDKNAAVWQVNNKYILKKSHEQEKDIEKTLMIHNFLRAERIPAAEYIPAVSGEYYVIFEGDIYSLMRKMNGGHLDAQMLFTGDYNLGIEMARLHKALNKIEPGVVYESDFMGELNNQIADIKSNNIDISSEIIADCLEFAGSYNLLPKQVIHRDMHLGNMLFENGRLACFLDFDSVQVNARIFDIAYFAQSMLFINDNYKSDEFVKKWRGFFNDFLRGYQSENKLHECEIKAIHKLCGALQINFISFYLWQEEKRYLVANRADLLKWIYANEQIFTFSLN